MVIEQTKGLPNKGLIDGEPCEHRGCLNHVAHPCENCGRIAGRKITSEYIKVPILAGFDSDVQIGTLEVLKSSLPINPEFVFTIGYKTAKGDKPFELKAVSISSDREFFAYLKEQLEMNEIYWWESKRPSDWTFQMHVEHPCVNCTTEAEKNLAKVIATRIK